MRLRLRGGRVDVSVFELDIPVARFRTHQAGIRMRGRSGTGAWMSSTTQGYKGLIERDVRKALSGVELPLIASAPLSLRLEFRYPSSGGGLEWRVKRPDLDNMLKLVKDALEGVLFTDDAQVCHLELRKVASPDVAGYVIGLRVERLASAPEAW